MKNKLFILGLSVFTLLTQAAAYALTIIDPPPSQSIVLKLPNNGHANWKEILRKVTEKEGKIECIPLDQTIQNWSELICIQFVATPVSDSMEVMLDRIRDGVVAAHPNHKITWNIIQKNQHDFLYEWILHEPSKGAPPYQEIARIFITDSGVHRIGFAHQSVEMGIDKREKWIRLFKESVSLVSFDEASSRLDGLSMADRYKDSLNLGPIFQSWDVKNIHSIDNAYNLVCRIPPTQNGDLITECLETVTAPTLSKDSVDKLFVMQKDQIRKNCTENVKFHILKKTPTEIIYYYSHHKNDIQLTGVVRTFTFNQGYYSISYKRGLQKEMQKEDIIQWAKKLQMIEVVDKAVSKSR